jgi:hypothetical protein
MFQSHILSDEGSFVKIEHPPGLNGLVLVGPTRSRIRARFPAIKHFVEALYGSVNLALACRSVVIGRFVRSLRRRRKPLERFAARVRRAANSYYLKPYAPNAPLNPTVDCADVEALAVRPWRQEFRNIVQRNELFTC